MLTSADSRTLQVAKEVDVLVVDGGPAGVGAALAASRNGATTLIVEQFNCLGGVATAGGHGHISRYDEQGTGRRIVGGVADEIARRVVEGGFGIRNSHGIWFEVEGLKRLLDVMAQEAGVSLLYHTFFCDTVVEDGVAVGVVVQSKDGRRLIRARQIVDATGDGDVIIIPIALEPVAAPDRAWLANEAHALRCARRPMSPLRGCPSVAMPNTAQGVPRHRDTAPLARQRVP